MRFASRVKQLRALILAVVAGHNGHIGIGHDAFRRTLAAHGVDGRRRRTNEFDATFSTKHEQISSMSNDKLKKKKKKKKKKIKKKKKKKDFVNKNKNTSCISKLTAFSDKKPVARMNGLRAGTRDSDVQNALHLQIALRGGGGANVIRLVPLRRRDAHCDRRRKTRPRCARRGGAPSASRDTRFRRGSQSKSCRTDAHARSIWLMSLASLRYVARQRRNIVLTFKSVLNDFFFFFFF
jgi:hypothetical protein